MAERASFPIRCLDSNSGTYLLEGRTFGGDLSYRQFILDSLGEVHARKVIVDLSNTARELVLQSLVNLYGLFHWYAKINARYVLGEGIPAPSFDANPIFNELGRRVHPTLDDALKGFEA